MPAHSPAATPPPVFLCCRSNFGRPHGGGSSLVSTVTFRSPPSGMREERFRGLHSCAVWAYSASCPGSPSALLPFGCGTQSASVAWVKRSLFSALCSLFLKLDLAIRLPSECRRPLRFYSASSLRRRRFSPSRCRQRVRLRFLGCAPVLRRSPTYPAPDFHPSPDTAIGRVRAPNQSPKPGCPCLAS
jgi:hypothetical protein